jgi:hypothetical protein
MVGGVHAQCSNPAFELHGLEYVHCFVRHEYQLESDLHMVACPLTNSGGLRSAPRFTTQHGYRSEMHGSILQPDVQSGSSHLSHRCERGIDKINERVGQSSIFFSCAGHNFGGVTTDTKKKEFFCIHLKP